MAGWDHGYVTDIPYIAQFHHHTSPVWVSAIATLNGAIPPDLTIPFTHADFGCGHGVTSLLSAAAMPHAEFWGFDFNPAHIRAARDIARRAGLTNIHFEEASFEELAKLPADALPKFDFTVAHGILSWISPENQRHLYDVIGQRLAPGGIAYLSYNISTGWAAMPPVRTLMRLLIESNPARTDEAASAAFDVLGKMKTAGAALFQAHPGLERRLAELRSQNATYVAHEFLNRDWHPMMFTDVATAMAAVKCEFAGASAVLENATAFTVPEKMREMFATIRDVKLRETVRDLLTANSFRRDLYQRGHMRATGLDGQRRASEIAFARTVQTVTQPLNIQTPLGMQTIGHPAVTALLDILAQGPRTIAALRQEADLTVLGDAGLIEAIMLLMTGGFVMPMYPGAVTEAAVETSARLNRVHVELLATGEDRTYLATPGLGSAILVRTVDLMAVDAIRSGAVTDQASLLDGVVGHLARLGRDIMQDGKPVTDREVSRRMVADLVKSFVSDHLPVYRDLGILAIPSWAEAGAGS